jgi:hypothetical protein
MELVQLVAWIDVFFSLPNPRDVYSIICLVVVSIHARDFGITGTARRPRACLTESNLVWIVQHSAGILLALE